MEYDVAMVGAGPAGLASAIRLKQLSKERGEDLSVCVLEKGAEVGSHILSGGAAHGISYGVLVSETMRTKYQISAVCENRLFGYSLLLHTWCRTYFAAISVSSRVAGLVKVGTIRVLDEPKHHER